MTGDCWNIYNLWELETQWCFLAPLHNPASLQHIKSLCEHSQRASASAEAHWLHWSFASLHQPRIFFVVFSKETIGKTLLKSNEQSSVNKKWGKKSHAQPLNERNWIQRWLVLVDAFFSLILQIWQNGSMSQKCIRFYQNAVGNHWNLMCQIFCFNYYSMKIEKSLWTQSSLILLKENISGIWFCCRLWHFKLLLKSDIKTNAKIPHFNKSCFIEKYWLWEL